jgi:predicted glycosyltransferase
MDYEHAQTPPLVRPRWEIVPEALLNENLHCKTREKIRTYKGIKEDVYAPEFKPDPTLVNQLGIQQGDITVTVRPPATEAHYFNPESETFFVEFMNRVCSTPRTRVILLPRNKKQEIHIRSKWPQWFKDSKVIIPDTVIDGLNLLWHSDLVVSGGGTMNREAAALGVPAYSIFRGKAGAVDRQLRDEGRLMIIDCIEDVQEKILIKPRDKENLQESKPRRALREIVDHIETVLRLDSAAGCKFRTIPSKVS